MDSRPSNNKDRNPVIIGVIAIAALVILVSMVTALKPKSSNTSENNTMTSQSAFTATTGTYKNGTYNADATYDSPGGTEELAVTVTLQNNTITDATVTQKAASSTSKQYQSDFISSYKKLVVGKNINEVKLSKVSGSSLTSSGFNDALAEIRNEARS